MRKFSFFLPFLLVFCFVLSCKTDNPKTDPGPVCGNSVIESGESCDDSNSISADGCSNTCQIETDYVCNGAPSSCDYLPTCFDGIKNGTESDIDCGGNDCYKCETGKACTFGSECLSLNCTAMVCQ